MSESHDWNFRLVKYFLKNTQLTAMLLVILVLGGLFAYSRFRVEGFPAVPVPIAVVTTVLPGASPDTVDSLVTVPIQDQLKNVKGLKTISSSSQTSVSSIILEFSDGADTTSSVQDIRTKISAVRLPDSAKTPDVFVPDTGGAPFVVAVTGQKTLQELLHASKSFTEKISQVEGIKSVSGFGNLKENIYIQLPEAITTPDVINQIKGSGTGFPLGQAIINNKLISIDARAQVKNIDDLKNFPITSATANGGETKKLVDIAQVYTAVDTAGEINRIGFKDGDTFKIQAAVLFTLRTNSDADVIKTSDKLIEALDAANRDSGDVRAVIVFNQAEDSKQQVKEIVEGAVGGQWSIDGPAKNIGYVFGALWLLVILMFLFLDFRSALVSIISLPLSFLFTFIVLQLLGIQLNTIVLFSLILVLGLIVDPAIVVLESIKRYMEIGYKGHEAVLRSVSVIGQGLFMAVFTSFIVFVPFALVSGTFGAIIKYIPITVIPALITSYFVPMVFLTWLGGKFLKAKTTATLKDENDSHTLWPVARWFIRTNRYILKHTWLSVVVVVLGLIIPIGIASLYIGAGKIKQVQFSAPPDSLFLAVTVPLAPNITLGERTMENAKLETILKNYAGVTRRYYYQTLDGTSSNTSLSVFIELLAPAERNQKSPEIASHLNDDVKKLFGEQSFVQELSAGPPTESYPVTVKIFENDPLKLQKATEGIAEQLRTYPEVAAVKSDLDKQAENVAITLDPAKAGGIPALSFYGQIAARFNEQTLFVLDGVDVVLKPQNKGASETIDSLKDIGVFGGSELKKVGDIATVERGQVPGSVRRLGGERFVEVAARVKDVKDIITVQRNITQWAKDNREKLGVNDRAFEDRAGVNEFEKSFQELFLAIAVSILLTYVVFVVFFKSFIQPLIILFSIPLLAVGVFPTLSAFAGGQLGFLEILGVIMVIGIVENVGIFLIDFANRKVAEGMHKKEAIALASGIRFRPIILTKLTALAGLLPLAIFAPFWRGLAIVVIMGIISSGILSLFTTPVLYSWFTRSKKIDQN